MLRILHQEHFIIDIDFMTVYDGGLRFFYQDL